MDLIGSLILHVIDQGQRVPIVIPSHWLPRWEALSNLVNDLQSSEAEWTLNTLAEIRQWIELNRRMDGGGHRDLIPLSRVARVVDVMLPSSEEWLLHVYIEEDDSNRFDLYYRVGTYVRTYQVRYPYNSMLLARTTTGLHYNLLLGLDVAYGATSGEVTIPTSSYPPGVLTSILETGPNSATGIMHTAWLLSSSSSYQLEEEEYMKEVPWDTIRWSDLVTLLDDKRVHVDEQLPDMLHVAVEQPSEQWTTALLSYIQGSHSPEDEILLGTWRTELFQLQVIRFFNQIPDIVYNDYPGCLTEMIVRVDTSLHYDPQKLTIRPQIPRINKFMPLLHSYISHYSKQYLYHITRPKNGSPTRWHSSYISIDCLIMLVLGSLASETQLSNSEHDPERYVKFWSRLDSTMGSKFISSLIEKPKFISSLIEGHSEKSPDVIKAASLVVSESTNPDFSQWPAIGK